MKEITAERMMLVVSGKKKVKLSFFMKISPGSLPNHGNLPASMTAQPMAAMIAPIISSVLPRSVIFCLRKVTLLLAVYAAAVLLAIKTHLL